MLGDNAKYKKVDWDPNACFARKYKSDVHLHTKDKHFII
jgi:hypothetical protein